MKHKFFISIANLLLFTSLIYANSDINIEYGLFIKSYPVSDNEKTSLVLENNKPIKLGKETSLSFDVFFRNENPFGMISRIITDNNQNIDLYIAVGDDGIHYPMLLINESIHMMSDQLIYNEWIPMSISFLASEQKISLTYGSKTLSIPYPVSEINDVRISFGLCPFLNYTIYDIASVNIRNIKLIHDHKLLRFWKLGKHIGDITHDSVANVAAITRNPQWIIEDYSTWEKRYSKQVERDALYTFDNKQEKLFILPKEQPQAIIIYDLKQNKETILQAKNNYPETNNYKRLLYDNLREQLVIYNQESKAIFTLSLKDLIWNSNMKSLKPQVGFQCSSTIYDAKDSTLISFGGYGYLKYNNELMRLNIYNDSVTQSVIPKIPPRFHASTTKIGDNLYIFSGRGSNTGRQEIFPKHYFDFYSLNLLTEEVHKFWELSENDDEFYVGENMVYDEQENCFYLLADIDNLTLLKIDKKEEGYEIMSFFRDEIHPKANYRNLYHQSGQKKFYALTSTDIDTPEEKQEINIFSLNYPPIGLNATIEADRSTKKSQAWLWIIISFLLFSCIVFFIFNIIKRAKAKNRISAKTSPKMEVEETISESEYQEVLNVNYYDFSKRSISILGDFFIVDKKGNDVTKLFSPTLRDILVLLILHSTKDGKGISTKELIKLFWYDKNEDAAKNNRNVYFSRLRSTLEVIGEIEIVNVNHYWKIELKEDIICDYIEAVKMLDFIKNRIARIEIAKIYKLLEILSRGILLPDIEIDWLDNFKRNFSNQVIDVLTEISQKGDYKLNDNLKMKIADILFMHDYLNEEALYLRCSSFVNSGKKGIARSVYDSFVKEYHDLLGNKYKYSLSDILNRKNIL